MTEPGATPGRILSRDEVRVSPWVCLVRKEVELPANPNVEVYHCLAQPDYIAILARTRRGLIPIVRQFRPAVEACTWELPAGLLEPGEAPEQACRRELREEAGLEAESITSLGTFYADTGRLQNLLHAFFVRATDPDPSFIPEPGLSLEFVTGERLRRLILAGEFRHQLHLGLVGLACLRHLDWGGGE